jgi:hypothetical protein
MADYFSPTVIQQSIPITDMTPLERLVLSLIFDAEPDGEAMYFHTSLGPSNAIGLSIDELRAAFDASAGIDSTATTYIAERVAIASTDDTEIEIDFSGTSWEFIFQDIVRRSSTPLRHRGYVFHLLEDAARRLRRHGGAYHGGRDCWQIHQ